MVILNDKYRKNFLLSFVHKSNTSGLEELMIYTLKNNIKRQTIEAYDTENNLIGEAVFSPFIPSDLYDNPRLNIYFDIEVKDIENKDNIKNQLFDEIMKRSKELKLEYNGHDVKVYHCCFPDNIENIEYYSAKPGFQHDEGMYIIKKDISEENFNIPDTNDVVELTQFKGITHSKDMTQIGDMTQNNSGVNYIKLNFQTEDEMLQLIQEQHKVFKNGYSIEDLKEIKETKQWFSIAAKHNGFLVGNVIMIVKEDENNNKYGWVDDFFVSKEFRKNGIGKNLLLRALKELKSLHVFESRLEVWSSNVRAMSLYQSLGYRFYKETECAIGMFL